MSHPPQHEIAMLNHVADELREVFGERGYRVDVALEADPAFGSGWSRGALTRDLVLDTVSRVAGRIGVDFRPVNGSGRELRFLSSGVDRRYRVLRARRTSDGALRVTRSPQSALSDDELPFYSDESWVFAWIPTEDGLIGDILIAEIVGYHDGTPGYLELGPPIALGSDKVPRGGFQPSDEPLDGFDDAEANESDESGSPDR